MQDSGFVYLTQERLVELEKEVKELKTAGRKVIAQKIAEARSHGDLSENAEYDAAKEEQGLMELKIRKLETTLARARIIDSSQFTGSEVHILSKVRIKNLKTDKLFEYFLVSPEEADFKIAKISITSPIGKSLLGKKVGDKVQVQVPAGLQEFEILEIQ
ncbi:MAG: transcription elongation factor GreA [Ignavibacteriales bacterium]|nr:transcription elongation factor GreA [Ignavibacteriales bacterium]